MSALAELTQKFRSVWPLLDERTRRLMAANEAMGLGYSRSLPGASRLRAFAQSHRKGHPRNRNRRGAQEGRIRRPGAGRKFLSVSDPRLVDALEQMIEGTTRGDPESALRWTCKSTRAIARQLGRQKHPASHAKVAQILHALGYSLQSNRKTQEGADHPDRDAQFRHIAAAVKRALAQGFPRDLGGHQKERTSRQLRQCRRAMVADQPLQVQGHDFPSPEVPRAYPYGIYDVGRNAGFVNVGTDHDTGAFAVASIRGWWRFEGKRLYPRASRILITADAGGSNGSRLRVWKLELQKFADETGLCISVCHFPPGTSKWNKVEHRLFSFISSNWRGEPLRDYETIVHLIAKTTTAKGLKVTCRLDRRKYPTGRKITDEEMKIVNVKRGRFHGDWNYVISPHT